MSENGFSLGSAFMQTPEFNQKLSGVIGDTVSHVGESVQQKKQEDAAQKTKFTWNSADNTVTGTMDADYMKQIASDLQAYKGVRAEYDKMLAQNAQQQANMRAHPFANTLAQIAAGLAQTDTNPITKGIGLAASRLNPTLPELQKQQMGMLEGKQGALHGQIGAMSNAARLGMEGQQLNLAQTRENRLAGEEQRKVTEDKTRDLRDFRDKQFAAAAKGEAAPADVLNKMFIERGLDPKLAAAQTDAIVKTNEAAKARIDADRKLTERRVSALERGVTAKTSDKAESDAALRETAKSIAAGDLTAIRDVTSMRGGQRTKLYAMIKELDPTFTSSNLDRKIAVAKSFDGGGKDGQAIQSFDTFLQHAGEVTETIKGVMQSGSPALNKPMNWWKKNMAGSPEYQRLLTSLEPVGKEFESFLLNNRALYADDRKKIDTILSGDSSPKMIMATLNEMGRTAKARYEAMNQRYKRVIGKDIDNAFSEEAIVGAKKIGVDVGGGNSSGAAPSFDDFKKWQEGKGKK